MGRQGVWWCRDGGEERTIGGALMRTPWLMIVGEVAMRFMSRL